MKINTHSDLVSLRIISVLFSVVVVTFTQEIVAFWIKLLTSTSAAAVALLQTTGVGRKGNIF